MSQTAAGVEVTVEAGCDSAALQHAVDNVAAQGGGLVRVPAGTCAMHNALRLRSGVRVVGDDGAVLLKQPSVAAELTQVAGYGHYELVVDHPERFAVGVGIHVGDEGSGGFYDTVATVVEIRGDALIIDRMLNHDYRPGRSPVVSTRFSLIDATDVTDAAVENLVLDGNPRESRALNGCRGGGVYLLRSRRVRVEAVTVRHYKGDALSFQQCADLAIRGCDLHDNTGGGIHPGSGSVRYLIENNRCHDNGGDGIYYCLRTTHSICRGNTLERNGNTGISIGERDTDHLVEGNTCRDNAAQGLFLRDAHRQSADRVVLRRNTVAGNARRTGRAQVEVGPGLADVHLDANTIDPAPDKPAIWIDSPTRAIHVTANTVAGRPQARADIAGPADGLTTDAPAAFPPVGPEAMAPDGAAHLGLFRLDPWRAP